jgi:HSP20 family protein
MSKTLTNRRPTSPVRSPFRGLFPGTWFDDLFDNYLDESGGPMAQLMGTAMDVSETDQAYEVRMDLPGVRTDEVDIQFANGTLTVRGERSGESEEKDEARKYHRKERYTGSFVRSVVLPGPVSDAEAAADFRDGVLKIVVPKSEESRPRKISIK